MEISSRLTKSRLADEGGNQGTFTDSETYSDMEKIPGVKGRSGDFTWRWRKREEHRLGHIHKDDDVVIVMTNLLHFSTASVITPCLSSIT